MHKKPGDQHDQHHRDGGIDLIQNIIRYYLSII